MLTKRIISCLDVKNGRTVKGINFESLRDMGDPVEQAVYYSKAKADELIFLDISATDEQRKTLSLLVKDIARAIDIPFTVGGGISTIEDVSILLESGADKISINTAAVKNPKLINQLSREFGSQCIVIAVDAKRNNGEWFVHLNGGKIPTILKVKDWLKQAQDLGAGEVLLTSIDTDGTRNGFAIELTSMASTLLSIPVIASGGAGTFEHFKQVFTEAKADAALAAGIFHERIVSIPDLKKYLSSNSINTRL